MDPKTLPKTLVDRFERRDATIGILGLGYVGLPLVLTFARKGFNVIGFDIDSAKVEMLERGESYIRHIPGTDIEAVSERFTPTTDFGRAADCDALLICVPTPLNRNREPDLSFIENTARAIGPFLRPGQLVILESTTYPGTTDGPLAQVLEETSGMKAGADFFLAYSPEREDPGNPSFDTARIPKVVGGLTGPCTEVAVALYTAAVDAVVPVSTARVAEMTKLLENIFRSVNIALVNELKVLSDRMEIDIWEVIAAAATKPFGYMPFYPGPGLGGHCIPIDPFYLTWKAREYELTTRFIELAGEINVGMPHYVVEKTVEALNARRKALNGANILLLGIAYKRDVDDVRESPALRIIELLRERGAVVSYHDPYVPTIGAMRKYQFELSSVPLTEATLAAADAVLIITDHTDIDYDQVVSCAQVVVDTRNATAGVVDGRDKIIKA